MEKNFLLTSIAAACLLVTTTNYAVTSHSAIGSLRAPQPTSCIKGTFANTGGQYWKDISLTLKNECGKGVDFNNATITFTNTANLNTSFWVQPGSLSYPDQSNFNITSQPSGNRFISSLSLKFPDYQGVKTILGNGQSFIIKYGAPSATYEANSVNVYLSGYDPAPQTGDLSLTNKTTQPSGVTQTYAIVNVMMNDKKIETVQLPWGGTKQLTALAAGSYTLQPESVSDSQGNTYQGTAIPNPIQVALNQNVNSDISYTQIVKFGSVNVKTPTLPTALTGYTGSPTITLTRTDTGAAISSILPWNTTTSIKQLDISANYKLTTPMINFNDSTCVGSFNPNTITSSSTAPATSQLTYQCTTVKIDRVTLNVSGLPTSTANINVTLTPNDGSAPVVQQINLSNGTGNATVNLKDGMVYNLSTSNVTGFTPTFNPQPLTATANGVATITYQKQATGRIMTYIPGWKTPPAATDLANAGYTNVLIAFGLFSTSQPGQIVPGFTTVTKAYIKELQNAGIKVSLSLGGASTSLPNTTVNFHDVLTKAASPTAFEQTFVQSVQNMVTEYGFDGIDIDIEYGLNAGGTFAQPTGDIAVMASILKKLRANNPNLLISLVPQVANVAATSGFDNTWGNYASLVMQTHDVLSWVGIQLYNTGCAFGIDQVCWDPNAVNSPNFTVAMATDLLANWPATDSTGRRTGFQPYIAYLNPSQVVVGYPAPNASGTSDGGPVTPINTIKRAIQCLRTAKAGANSCDTYVPPAAYPGIGGVFNWEATYDQNNGFKFASGLKACVLQSNCS